jgi:hypothetical protein
MFPEERRENKTTIITHLIPSFVPFRIPDRESISIEPRKNSALVALASIICLTDSQ